MSQGFNVEEEYVHFFLQRVLPENSQTYPSEGILGIYRGWAMSNQKQKIFGKGMDIYWNNTK